jgi:hypothetical protein
MHSSALLGWFGAALSIALPWPQFWRSVVRGRIKGLSATACWQAVGMPLGWITYGLLTGGTVQVVTNIVTGLAGLAVLVMMLVKESELRSGRRLLVSAAGAVTVVSAAAVSAGADLLTGVGAARAGACLGAVLACSAILGAIPQPLSLLRDRGQDLAGLSPLRWWLAAGSSGSWCAYGLATGRPAVWLSALAGLSSALVVCWVLVNGRRATSVLATDRSAQAPAVTGRPTQVGVLAGPPAKAAVGAAAAVVRAPRGSFRVVRPALTTMAASQVSSVSAPAFGGPVFGTARATARPAGGRPARGVAPVPRPTERPTLIMTRELAAA